MLPQVVRSQINGNARSCSCHQCCSAAAVQQMPTRATSHSDTSNWLSPPQPLLPDRQPHCSAFSSAAVRGDTATARACSSRSGEDGSTGGHHAARRQGQQQRLCFARACARLVPVERGAGRPAGRSGQGGWVVICPTASDRATALRCRLCAAMSTGGISLRRSRLRARRAATTRCAVHDRLGSRRSAQAGRRTGAARGAGWVVICPTASDRATVLRCRLGRPRARPCPRLKTLLYVRFVHLRAPVRLRANSPIRVCDCVRRE